MNILFGYLPGYQFTSIFTISKYYDPAAKFVDFTKSMRYVNNADTTIFQVANDLEKIFRFALR